MWWKSFTQSVSSCDFSSDHTLSALRVHRVGEIGYLKFIGYFQENYFNLTYGIGCEDCACNETGSRSLQCNEDGWCSCKFGVGGKHCDHCEPGYFGLTENGCKGNGILILLEF